MLIENKEMVVSGTFARIARLRAEYYEWIDDPAWFVSRIKATAIKADLFTFVDRITRRSPRTDYLLEWDSIAVLSITRYEHWWKNQINDKTRNMIRKAKKSGVVVRPVEFNDDLIKGIKEIYDESPLRQGRPFKHYRKDFETLKREHATFLDRSQFIAAFFGDELIGFVKLVYDEGMAHLMQIISKISARNKAPTNALIAKAVKICADKKISYLHYGIWSKRGLGDFKRHHSFERLDLCRYFIPLNWKGRLILAMMLHRPVKERLPESLLGVLVSLRSKWNARRLAAKNI